MDGGIRLSVSPRGHPLLHQQHVRFHIFVFIVSFIVELGCWSKIQHNPLSDNLRLRLSDFYIYRILHNLTTPNMTSSLRSVMDSGLEKDAMSIKSTSTARSTTSLLRSLVPSKREKTTEAQKHTETPVAKTETPAQKAERKRIEAEARFAWAISR